MPTLRINSAQATTILASPSSPTQGQLGTTNTSFSNNNVDSNIFGHSGLNAVSHIFVFQGTPPSGFSEFTSISTRLSDLLVAIPIQTSTAVTSTNSARWLVGASTGVSRSVSIANISTSLVRSSNVVTVTATASYNVAGVAVYPGQPITISGVTTDTSFNGTFTVATVPSATTFTFSQTGSNSSVNGTSGTITVPYQATASGTASWFCMCRTNATWTPSAAFTGFGAMIGSIGAVGSGADLEIASTNIVAGSTYTSAGMYLNMPFSWTF